ncbi:FG-GAP repeat domain-containing protein [Haloferula sp. A504]|uniref:FG-GAP repeat domain-containing protein n=1 Tax=Haloferula sp. A504 TaxID=3373601 RepID=UPI0031C2F19E|nr:VCBS repeat-containing protein [Verrucomicrobiaceae bacterium E54]
MRWMPPMLLAMVVTAHALKQEAGDGKAAAFERFELTREFWSEGVDFGDLNHDGEADVVAGPHWWAGPDFEQRHSYGPSERKSPSAEAPHRAKNPEGEMVTVAGFPGAWSGRNGYSDCFQLWCDDFNGDGWDDVLVVSFPGKEAFWYANPRNEEGDWKRHVAYPAVDNESPLFVDVTGDGRRELVFHTELKEKGGACLGYAAPDPANATAPWRFHPVSAPHPDPKPQKWGRFHHGLGAGDVNGDGRIDLLMNHGWWQQPESLKGDPEWKFHAADFAPQAAQIHVDDVNGDGRNDVVTALEAHGHGLAWHEQGEDGTFRRHEIMGKTPEASAGGVVFTQPHAVEMADMDGDGLTDIVTGKRFWAHGPNGDVDPDGTPVLYWFKLSRDGKGGASYEPRLIDRDSGVGTQFAVRDVNGDQRPDVAIANKRGVYVFRQRGE